MSGSDDGDPHQPVMTAPSTSATDHVVKVMTELVQSVASLSARLAAMEACSPYGLPRGGTTAPFLSGNTSTSTLPFVPIHQIHFPHSPSPIPSMGQPSTGFTMGIGAPPPFLGSHPTRDTEPTIGALRFYKLDFATYDDSDDPLNWLNR
ncbi:hypothetical protein GUJ93_ZPchr0006g41067, partial [Zizania palustris]